MSKPPDDVFEAQRRDEERRRQRERDSFAENRRTLEERHVETLQRLQREGQAKLRQIEARHNRPWQRLSRLFGGAARQRQEIEDAAARTESEQATEMERFRKFRERQENEEQKARLRYLATRKQMEDTAAQEERDRESMEKREGAERKRDMRRSRRMRRERD